MGGILHRIIEDMNNEEKDQPKASKGYMKPKKAVVF